MKKISILAGAALLSVAGAALAQSERGPRPDRNADISRQQAVDRADQRFARLDANNDGRFTPEEARALGEQRHARRAGRLFDRLDLDRNGSITREEMAQARERHRAERGERGQRPGRGGMRGGRLFGEQGFVTREQFRERAVARFDRLDADRDGTVTAAERRQAREQMRQRRSERRSRG